MRDSQLRGRSRLTGLLHETHEAAEEMAAEAVRFEKLKDGQAAPRAVVSFNLFQTPVDLATRVVGIASLPGTGRVLEPSAGLGRIYSAIRALSPDLHVTMVDISPDCCAELERIGDKNSAVMQSDFLELTPDVIGMFDAVVMNPPFKMGRDIKHIEHAMKFLLPGGTLVSICYNGPWQQAKLKPQATDWIDLPEGSFASEGTRAETAVFVYEKPCGTPA